MQFMRDHGQRAKRKGSENSFIYRVESFNMDATNMETGNYQIQQQINFITYA